jgi:hypothetical protein
MGVGGPCECGACVQVVQASRRLPLLEEEKEEKNHVFLASLNPGTTMPASGLSHSSWSHAPAGQQRAIVYVKGLRKGGSGARRARGARATCHSPHLLTSF